MNSALLKSTFRSIRNTFSRFISIVLIVAIGLAFFAGVKATSPGINKTTQKYFLENNLFDLRILSTLGLTNADVDAISKVENVEYVMPTNFVDALVWVNGEVESDIDGSQISTRAYGIDLDYLNDYHNGIIDGSFINKPTLLDGTYPTKADECLVDASDLSTPESFKIGAKIRLEGDRDSIFATLNTNEFTIVGIIRNPYYVSFERGNSLVGSGKIGTYMYIPTTAFETDYYSEVYVKVRGANQFGPYSDEYFDFVNQTGQKIYEISTDRLSVRATQLNVSLPAKIAEATAQINAKQAEVSSQFADAETQIEQLRLLATNGDSILAAAQAEYNSTFTEAQKALLESQEDYNQKLAIWNEQDQLVSAAKIEWQNYYNTFVEANNKYNEYATMRDTARIQLTNANNVVTTVSSAISTARAVMNSLNAVQSTAMSQEQLQGVIAILETAYPELYQSLVTLSAQGTVASAAAIMEPMIAEKEAELAEAKTSLAAYQEVYNTYDSVLNQAYAELKTAETTLATSKTYLDAAKSQLSSTANELNKYASALSDGQNTVTLEQIKAQQEIYQLQVQVENADTNLATAEAKLNEKKAEYNKEILKAQTLVNNGNKLLSSVSSAVWYVYDRTETPGYSNLDEMIDSIETLANIFPAFFLIVAAIVCLTIMTRMIAEERTQIGTLKALGYSNEAIISKYAIYAAFAGILGSILGISIGMYVFPHAIYSAFGIMYDLPSLELAYPVGIIIISVVIALIATIVTAIVACWKELKGVPSLLMLPKPPKVGRHVFLEKIPFIWKNLSFSSRIAFRNAFRNAQRCLMTIIGIGGCTALVLVGFGLYDSVSAIMDQQFRTDPISVYDFQVVYSDPQDPETSVGLANITTDYRVESAMLTSMTCLDGTSEHTDDKYDVYVMVPQDAAKLNGYIRLRNPKSGEELQLDDTGALITEKFADETKTKVGDTVIVTTSDNLSYEIRVAGIVENYTFHYIYLTRTAYTAIFGKEPSFKYAMGRITDKVRTEALEAAPGTITDKTLLATDLMKHDNIFAVSYTTDAIETFTEIIDVLSFVITIFIITAALIAFVILYTLSNINIQERKVEISTLKVLGFYDNEVSSYIFRENLMLTVIGTLLGLLLGIIAHGVIIDYLEVSAVMFGKSIYPMSFLYATLATFTFSVIIALIMGNKLKKIIPAEYIKARE